MLINKTGSNLIAIAQDGIVKNQSTLPGRGCILGGNDGMFSVVFSQDTKEIDHTDKK